MPEIKKLKVHKTTDDKMEKFHAKIVTKILPKILSATNKSFYIKNLENFKNMQNSIVKTGKKTPGEYRLSVNLGNAEYTDKDYQKIKEIFATYLSCFFGSGINQTDSVNFNLLRSKGDKVYYMKYILQESKKSKLINNILTENFVNAKSTLKSMMKTKTDIKLSDVIIIEI